MGQDNTHIKQNTQSIHYVIKKMLNDVILCNIKGAGDDIMRDPVLERLNKLYHISAELKCCVSPDAEDEVVYSGAIHTGWWLFEFPVERPDKSHVRPGQTVEAALAERLSEIFVEPAENITVQIKEMSVEEKVDACKKPAIQVSRVFGPRIF
jgi:hypothetical protein